GTLTVSGGSNIEAADNITLTAGGDISFLKSPIRGNAFGTRATVNVTIQSFGGSVLLTGSPVSGLNRITIVSAGSIQETGGLVSSNELVLTAATGISIPDAHINTLQALNTTSGDL